MLPSSVAPQLMGDQMYNPATFWTPASVVFSKRSYPEHSQLRQSNKVNISAEPVAAWIGEVTVCVSEENFLCTNVENAKGLTNF